MKLPTLGGYHNPAVFPRAYWARAGGIAEMFGNGAGGKEEVIKGVALVEPRAFFVGGGSFRILLAAFAKSLNGHVINNEAMVTDAGVVGDHVLVQLHIPASGIAPAKISLAVVVNEHGWINVVILAADQRFADGIGEGPKGIGPPPAPRFRVLGAGNTDTISRPVQCTGPPRRRFQNRLPSRNPPI